MTEIIPYVERLRRSGMKSGNCQLRGEHSPALEFHHECYKPERGLHLCHKCHHMCHWYPWKLKQHEIKKLLLIRQGAAAQIRASKYQATAEKNVLVYVPLTKPKKSSSLKP